MCVVDSLMQGAAILSLVRVAFTEEEVRLGCGGAEPKGCGQVDSFINEILFYLFS